MIIGLTGGIGAGKTTIAQYLKKLGARVIDADQVARIIVEPGKPAWKEIKTVFGPQYFYPDGTLDRKALGRLVFSDELARRKLNAITHPRIREEIIQQVQKYQEEDPQGIIVIEAPLLLEAGMEDMVDEIWLVTAPLNVRLSRIRERDGLTEEEALKRLTAQLPEEVKRKRATRIFENGGDLEATLMAVRRVFEELRGRIKP